MKTLKEYIGEGILSGRNNVKKSSNDLLIGREIQEKVSRLQDFTQEELDWMESNVSVYKMNNFQLWDFLDDLSRMKKYNNISLNWIDTSDITDMEGIFSTTGNPNFNGDISKWDVSNVKIMNEMFSYNRKFNGDISKWDVSSVVNMDNMFCNSVFNGDISNWDVSNVDNMVSMFSDSKNFNCDISKWDVSNVQDMRYMFDGAKKFNKDLSKWKINTSNNSFYTIKMFNNCPIKEQYKPKNIATDEDYENLKGTKI